MKELMEQIGRLVTVLFLLAVKMVVAAWVLTCLWRWYVVGILGVETLTIAGAIGLMTVAMCLRGARRQDTKGAKAEYSEIVKGFLWSMGYSMFILLIGRIAKYFL